MNKNNNPGQLKPGVRILLLAAGTIFVGLAGLGMFVPLLPTTPFLLLAAFCYARSSQRLYSWLLNNRWFGIYITNYLQKRGIPLRLKLFTIITLWVTIGISVVFFTDMLIVRIALVIIAGLVTLHLCTVPTLKG